MASYIDNIFQNARTQDVTPYTPDWSFLEKGQSALSTIQKKNFADFAQRYNSIINSDLTRDENIRMRDEYKKQADEELKRITSMDLTDPRNVKAAESLFEPLVNDKGYISDILNTKSVKDSFVKANQYANSLNPEERDLYNEASLKELNYFIQDYRSASTDQAMNMRAPSYLQGVNLEKMALNFFNKQGYDVSVDQVTNQWIVKTKNGALIENNLKTSLFSEFYSDPLVKRNLALSYTMNKRDYIEQNLPRFNGDRSAAEYAYNQERYAPLITQLQKEGTAVKEEIDAEIESAEIAVNELNNGSNTDNIPVDNEVLEYRKILADKVAQLKGTKEILKQEDLRAASGTTGKSISTGPYSLNIGGKSYSPEQLEIILFQGEVGRMAKNLAYSRFSSEVKDNPYAMEAYKSDLSWRNKQRELQLGYQIKSALQKEKAQLDGTVQGGQYDPNEPIPIKQSVGELIEGTQSDPNKIVKFFDDDLQIEAATVNGSKNKVVKTMIGMFPKMTTKSLDQLTDKEKDMIVTKGKNLIKAGALSKNKHNILSTVFEDYNLQNQVFVEKSKMFSENLRAAINASTFDDDEDKRILLEGLKKTSSITALKDFYIKAKAPLIAKQRSLENARIARNANNPFNPLNIFYGIRSAFGDPVAKASETFDDLMKSSSSVSISTSFLEKAKQEGNLGVGGITSFGASLGEASNIRNTAADAVANSMYQALIQNKVNTAVLGDIDYARGDSEKASIQVGDAVAELLVRSINQNLKETTGSLRSMRVNTFIDPFTGEQYVNFRPNEKLVEEVYNSKTKAGLLSKAQADAIIAKGITYKLPKNAIPGNVLGIKQDTPAEKLFKLKGTHTIGGNMTADGGKIQLTLNRNTNTFDVIANRYTADGKVIPLSQTVEAQINQEYQRLLAMKNQGMPVDPEKEILRLAQDYYIKSFKEQL